MVNPAGPVMIFDRQMKEERDYWLDKLSQGIEDSNLRPDYPRPESYLGKTGAIEVSLAGETYQKLMKLTSGGSFLLYTTLMAALKICLYKYTGSNYIAVGSPALREDDGLHQPSNVLTIIDHLSDQLSFRQLLLNVRQTLLDAYARQRYPFDRLLRDLGLETIENHGALFDVALSLQDIHGDLPEMKNDVTITFVKEPEQISGRVVFNESLFERASIERFAGHWVNAVRAGLENTNALLAEIQILTDDERHQLLVAWNNTRVGPRPLQGVHQLFEARAEQSPHAVAVVFEGQHLTYHELNRRANQLAHAMRARGVSLETLVAICVERSPEMMTGILAVLKAGGAYAPLDPEYPHERLAFLLADTGAKVLLTQERFLARLPEHSAQVICLDTGWAEIAAASEQNPGLRVKVDNLAYVIHTSGSTGTPKGCLIAHRSVVNHNVALAERFGLGPEDRTLQFAALSFDVVVEEVFPSWLSGGVVVLSPRDVTVPDIEFARLIQREGVTVVNQAASQWHAWVRALYDVGGRLPTSLRLVVVGVERVLPELLAMWQEMGGARASWMNAYGTTETTVSSILYDEFTGLGGSDSFREIPIGRPIANTQAFLLDAHLQPVPVRVPGELYVGGDCLARGYLNHPALTAARFLPLPYGDEPGMRLYRTGDVAQYLADGNIEFMGRVDYQVKIRGYRIELEEIETVLRQHPAVQEAVALVREDEPDSKRLVAYVVAAGGQEPTTSELRRFLGEKLPEYMVPSAFVMLEALPLTPNGKVDRRALPAPEGARPELEKPFAAPRTPVEEALVGIWAKALGIKQVGIHDNFFELGGDSILIIQIIARANQAGLRFTPRQLFENQTVAGLAAAVDAAPAAPVEQASLAGAVPLLPVQRWFFEYGPPNVNHYNWGLLFEAKQPLDPALLERAVAQLFLHHDGLRLRFEREASGWRQVYADGEEPAPFVHLDLSALSETGRRAALSEAAASLQASLNLAAGPVARVAFFDFGRQDRSRLLFLPHHIVIDGISYRIVLEDLETAYRQLGHGQAVQLPPKTTSFKQWGERLSEYARSKEVERELAYWLSEPRSQVPPLPVDYAGGVNDMASARWASASLSVAETQTLLRDAPLAYGTQINDVLLTAMAQALARWSGERLLLVEIDGHGREDLFEGVDLSRTVGWFTSLFPVLLDLRGVQEPIEALQAVKEQLGRIPQKGIDYGVLRYLSGNTQAAEALRALPQAEVSFNYTGQLDPHLSASHLFRLAPDECGPHRDPRMLRTCLMDVNSQVIEGQLSVSWTYSQNLHRRSTVEGLARAYVEALREIVAHCLSLEAKGTTPTQGLNNMIAQ